MNIALQGKFLGEGLRQLGHSVQRIPADMDGDLGAFVSSLGSPVDLVLLELWGNERLPQGLDRYPGRLAAWCIDSPLNEFWTKHACSLFDHVFLDQPSTLASFQRRGLSGTWLPLCAQSDWFVPRGPREYDITFIGSTSPERNKRSQLLALIGRHFSLHTAKTASLAESQTIFSRSLITLNENLFPGLTLRVFQGLAAGSLVLTEALPGISPFRDGEHLACYGSRDVLQKTGAILDSPTRYAPLARAGQELCREGHTSCARAAQMLARLEESPPQRQEAAERRWSALLATHRYLARFGGRLGAVANGFAELARAKGPHAAEAMIELGDIHARRGRRADALRCYRGAAKSGAGPRAWIKLALAHAGGGEMARARGALRQAAGHLAPQPELGAGQGKAEIFLDAARLYLMLGDGFEPGFAKPWQDPVPDTAYEAAKRAWTLAPDAAAMEILLESVAPSGLEWALLPDLLNGIRQGRLADSQILRAARLAEASYDPDTAQAILDAWRQRKSA